MNCTGGNCTAPNAPIPTFAIVTWVTTIVIGAISICINAITITVIRKSATMRSPCFTLLAGCSFGSLLLGVVYVGTNVARVGEASGVWSIPNRIRGVCLITNMYGLTCAVFPYSAQTVTLVAIDRLISIIFPIKYRSLGKRYVISSLSFCASFATIEAFILISVGGPLNKAIPACTMAAALGPAAFMASNDINMTLNILCVLCYLTMFISAYVQKRKMSKRVNGGFATASEQAKFLKQQAVIMPAAKMLSILYVIIAVTPSITINFVPFAGSLYFASFQLSSCTALVEFASLTSRCQRFREGLVQMFWKNRVVPIGKESKTVTKRV